MKLLIFFCCSFRLLKTILNTLNIKPWFYHFVLFCFSHYWRKLNVLQLVACHCLTDPTCSGGPKNTYCAHTCCLAIIKVEFSCPQSNECCWQLTLTWYVLILCDFLRTGYKSLDMKCTLVSQLPRAPVQYFGHNGYSVSV